MLLNIRNILIIVKKEDHASFKKLLGNGKNFGVKIKYAIQNTPRGLPDAFIIGRKFIKGNNVALILGDNFFHGQGLIEFLNKGSNIFAATPGLSLTPTKVIFESFLVKETPLIMFVEDTFFLLVMREPETFFKEDLTSISILFSLASCIECGCITLAPKEAISNISS